MTVRHSADRQTVTNVLPVPEQPKQRQKRLTSMLSKLGVTQDLFAELQAISVLLVLVTPLQQWQRNDSDIDLAGVIHVKLCGMYGSTYTKQTQFQTLQ